MPLPEPGQVQSLMQELTFEFQGLVLRIGEMERLRYGEHKLGMQPETQSTPMQIKTGGAGELIENVKASMVTNPPTVHFKPRGTSHDAQTNSTLRENFWNAWLMSVLPQLNDLADAMVGLGVAVAKAVYYPAPPQKRKRYKGEKKAAFLERVKAIKQEHGPPFRLVPVHPLNVMWQPGPGNSPAEVIEHSWKPKLETYLAYGLRTDDDLKARTLAAMEGMPTEDKRAAPVGASTSNKVLVTEYTCPFGSQSYINNQLIFEDENDTPRQYYRLITGRRNSSGDLDKFGMSIADSLRFVEAPLDRLVTQVYNAADLIVRPRLTIEMPQGGVIPQTTVDGPSGTRAVDKTWTFNPDKIEALPPGSKVVNPFEDAASVFGVIPMIQLLQEIIASHGVAPIFKGIPPGAAGSGYRDNSLYMMAKSMYQYMVNAFQEAIADVIRWMERYVATRLNDTIYMDEFELNPSDIADFPCQVTVSLDPILPQNKIADGQFWMDAAKAGFATFEDVQTEGFKRENPEEIEYTLIKETAKQGLVDKLIADVETYVGLRSQATPAQMPPVPQLVGPDGQPIQSAPNPMAPPPPAAPGGVQEMMAAMGDIGADQPPIEPGSFPPQ